MTGVPSRTPHLPRKVAQMTPLLKIPSTTRRMLPPMNRGEPRVDPNDDSTNDPTDAPIDDPTNESTKLIIYMRRNF